MPIDAVRYPIVPLTRANQPHWDDGGEVVAIPNAHGLAIHLGRLVGIS